MSPLATVILFSAIALLVGLLIGRPIGRKGYLSPKGAEDLKENSWKFGQINGFTTLLRSTASDARIVERSKFFKIKKCYRVIAVNLTKLNPRKAGIYFLLLDMSEEMPIPVIVTWGEVLVLGPETNVFKMMNLEDGKNYIIGDSPITKRHQEYDENDKLNRRHSLYAQEVI